MASYLFDTIAEANAFLEGVQFVNNPDIDADGPIKEGGKWAVVIATHRDEEDE